MSSSRSASSWARTAIVPSVLVVLTVVALVLVGPFGDDSEESAAPGTETGSSQGPPDPETRKTPDTFPLTGLRARGRGPARRHPAMVVKMDNTAASAPQVGLGGADLVVEELVEGGLTRLAAFFYSEIPGDVGPVRSMRASDIPIVAPVDASVVTSGAASVTIDRIRGAGIRFFNEEAQGFFRAADRTSPYDLMADLRRVTREASRPRATRPKDYLPFAPLRARTPARGAKKASGVAATFSGSHTTTWRWNGKHYDNTDGFAAPDQQFAADNVLVLRVQVGDAGYLDPAGNPVPETRLRGTGGAVLLHDGVVERGSWTKGGPRAPLKLRTSRGELLVPPGRTWIELVPADGGSVTVAD